MTHLYEFQRYLVRPRRRRWRTGIITALVVLAALAALATTEQLREAALLRLLTAAVEAPEPCSATDQLDLWREAA
jgi:hypothetical protein